MIELSKHLNWDIYNIHAMKTEIHSVMLRGRIRKFGLEQVPNPVLSKLKVNKEERYAL